MIRKHLRILPIPEDFFLFNSIIQKVLFSYFQEVCDWLYEHGYTFKVGWIANSDSSSLAIHGLYDTGWFTREEMQEIINQEAENQIHGR